MIHTSQQAFQLLESLDAPPRLILHAQLVSEVSTLLTETFLSLNLQLDKTLVEIGAILHDSGKIIHPLELAQSGSKHELAGESLLLKNDVRPEIARICLTHAQWKNETCSLEELTVALSDKLWKGKREKELELLVIDKVAKLLNKDRWEIFVDLDAVFEDIAADGAQRLARSTQF